MLDRIGHAEHFEVDAGIFLVEDPQHDPFAGAARDGRDAHVDLLAAERQGDAAVLRQPALGNVEPGHHLDPADHHRRDVGRHAQGLAKNAVHPQPHHQTGLIGLDMDVADALAGRVGDDAVDQADRRRIVGRVEQILGARQAGDQIVAEAERSSGIRGRLRARRIEIGKQPIEGLRIDLADRERPREEPAQFDQRLRIGVLAHGDVELAVILLGREQAVTASEAVGDADQSGLRHIALLSPRDPHCGAAALGGSGTGVTTWS